MNANNHSMAYERSPSEPNWGSGQVLVNELSIGHVSGKRTNQELSEKLRTPREVSLVRVSGELWREYVALEKSNGKHYRNQRNSASHDERKTPQSGGVTKPHGDNHAKPEADH